MSFANDSWGSRTLLLRVDMFSALNSAVITTVNTAAQFASPTTNTTITNLACDANGAVTPSRSRDTAWLRRRDGLHATAQFAAAGVIRIRGDASGSRIGR